MIDHSVFKNKTAAYYTLGCKLNFAETSAIGRILKEQGIRKADHDEQADICIVNTCSVTQLADKKCRQLIHRIAKEHPEAFIIATGCYAQLKPEEVAAIEGVDLVLGNEQKEDIMLYLERIVGLKTGIKTIVSSTEDLRAIAPSCSYGDRTRRFLKVQDGCDYFCTYCAIPYARGRSRNGSISSIVEQAKEVVIQGGKEIVLTGVNIGDFGKSTGENFLDLIRALDEVEGIKRYRISSIEPNLLTDEIIDFVASSRHFARHFHIPLQSGSDEVLKLMKRRYSSDLFLSKIEQIHMNMPHAFIGVDVIVGMRGETDDLFKKTWDLIENLDISQLHVFTYSEREGTKALEIDCRIPDRSARERSRILLGISNKKLADFYEQHIGATANVLFEHPKNKTIIQDYMLDGYPDNKAHLREQDRKLMFGYTDNYIKVQAPYDFFRANHITRVVLGPWNSNKDALTCTLHGE